MCLQVFNRSLEKVFISDVGGQNQRYNVKEHWMKLSLIQFVYLYMNIILDCTQQMPQRSSPFRRKARRWGITVDEFDMDLLSTISDSGLFKKIGNENHCLHQLLPKVHEVPSYNLRPKPTVYNLPCPKIKKLLNSFIYRCAQINL